MTTQTSSHRLQEVALQAKLGDQQALETLVADHEIKLVIYKIIQTHGIAWNDADDIYQDVLLKISQKISTWQGQSKITTWIGSIASNRCKDWKKAPDALVFVDELPEFPGEHAISFAALVEQVVNILHDIGEPCAPLLKLYLFEGVDQPEMIAMSGLSKSNFYRRLGECRERLEQQIWKML